MKKLGSPVMTNLYYGTVKQLLERVSSVMVDRESIGHLTAYVKESCNNGPILQEIGLERELGAERGLRALLVLAFVFPSHFMDASIIDELISLLHITLDLVAPLALSIIGFIGNDPFIKLISSNNNTRTNFIY